MAAFIDMRCVQCGKKYGYLGELKDAKCPHCGVIPVGLDSLERQVQQAMAEMDRKMKKEWDERTPKQDQVFSEGQKAFAEQVKQTTCRTRMLDHHKLNPYKGTELHKWFVKGWMDAFLKAERSE